VLVGPRNLVELLPCSCRRGAGTSRCRRRPPLAEQSRRVIVSRRHSHVRWPSRLTGEFALGVLTETAPTLLRGQRNVLSAGQRRRSVRSEGAPLRRRREFKASVLAVGGPGDVQDDESAAGAEQFVLQRPLPRAPQEQPQSTPAQAAGLRSGAGPSPCCAEPLAFVSASVSPETQLTSPLVASRGYRRRAADSSRGEGTAEPGVLALEEWRLVPSCTTGDLAGGTAGQRLAVVAPGQAEDAVVCPSSGGTGP